MFATSHGVQFSHYTTHSLWASNRNPAPPGGFLETTIFGNLSHRAIEIRLPAKIPVLDKAVRALFSKWPPNFNKCLVFGIIFCISTIFNQFNEILSLGAILYHNKE